MNEELDIELIDRYIRNDLTSHELSAFNVRLQNDLKFNELFQFIKNLQDVTKVKGREDIRESVKEVFNASKSKSNEKPNQIIDFAAFGNFFESLRLRPVYLIAATVSLLIIATTIIVYNNNRTSTAPDIARNNVDTTQVSQLLVQKLIAQSRQLNSNTFIVENIKNQGFGFAATESIKSSPIIIRIMNDKKYSMNYILFSDTLLLLGRHERTYIKKVSNTPNYLYMHYAEKFYRIKKVERTLLSIREEKDSVIIKAISK
jgi:hypothetical protein